MPLIACPRCGSIDVDTFLVDVGGQPCPDKRPGVTCLVDHVRRNVRMARCNECAGDDWEVEKR